jgi:hypothetical protein
MTPVEQARILAHKADEDIHVLMALKDDADTSDAVWGFHAQQAVERLLKALLARRGVRFPFTHRLLELGDLLADAGSPLSAKFEPLLDLTPYAVELRYSVLPVADEPPLDRMRLTLLIQAFRTEVEDVVK